ncbi:MAG: hypothetical protein COW84_11635 [Gammaproteobacteria bacterium CG22_combo_CG10-13_8_21_14_all_40_8]|nr:MAG: hypothetical protein COW84_11635 [Gammaproteobacteria bacterium CG22_combo_CG10-13_8_21_14_all_40_8]
MNVSFFKKSLATIIGASFMFQVQAQTRVIPCDNQGCSDMQLVKQEAINVSSDLPDGLHQVYVHNIEDQTTVYFNINRFYEYELGRTIIRAVGPLIPDSDVADYIKVVYELERETPFEIVGIENPPIYSGMFGTIPVQGYSAYSGFFPLFNNATIANFGGIAQLGSTSWAGTFSGVIMASLAEATGGTFSQISDALNNSMGVATASSQSGSAWEWAASLTAEVSAIFTGAKVEGSGTYTGSSSTTNGFSTNIVAPQIGVVYSDGMIVAEWDPQAREWKPTKIVDSEGQVIPIVNGVPQVPQGITKVTPGNVAIYNALMAAGMLRVTGLSASLGDTWRFTCTSSSGVPCVVV